LGGSASAALTASQAESLFEEALKHLASGSSAEQARGLAQLRLAALGGSSGARVKLGLMYQSGDQVPLDATEAYAWLMWGAEGGDRHFLVMSESLRITLTKAEQQAARQRLAALKEEARGARRPEGQR
jgi:TPR repeat protein